MEWIWFGKGTCPLTRKRLHPSNFQLDASLQQEIREWKKQNGTQQSRETDEADEELNDKRLEEDEEQRYYIQEQKKKEELIRLQTEGLRQRMLQKRKEHGLKSLQNQQRQRYAVPEVPSYMRHYV